MMLAFPAAMALVHQCAPGIAPEAMLSIILVESTFDPLAINVNHVGRLRAGTADAAAAIARRWLAAGYSVDLGLAQINSKNFGWTGLSLADAFTPCANLAAAQKILTLSYTRASQQAQGLDAISLTFSLYNSGNTITGFRNNYVARVWRAAVHVVSRISVTPIPASLTTLGGSDAQQSGAIAPSPSFVVAPADGRVLMFK